MAPTFRFGSQVGLSPLFSLSISSTLSDVPCIGNLKLDSTTRAGISLSSSGLSRTGPSHKSVRMLSSETLLVITFSLGGVVESGIIAGLVGGVPRPPPRSSWKIGMLERFHMLRLSLYRHHEEIGRFARVSVGEEARTWRLVVCKAGRDGGASLGCAVLCCAVLCCAVLYSMQDFNKKDDSIKAQVSVHAKARQTSDGIRHKTRREKANRKRGSKESQ
jgi:hypothetical protein